MDVALRKADPADADQIAVVGAAVWIATYAREGLHPDVASYLLEEFSASRIAVQVAGTASCWLLAEVHGHLAGYAQVRHGAVCPDSARHAAELVNLYVLDAFTGTGIGTRLLREAERIAADRDERLWLSVKSDNARAVRFYARRGYRKVGELYFELVGQRHLNDILVCELLQ